MKLNHNSVSYGIATVEDLELIESPLVGDTVVVTDENRGGVFIYRADGDANNGTIFASSSTGKWHRQYEGSVNVKWFGAVGDGVTDDTTTIQNAIDYVAINNLNEVIIPSGTYKITSTLTDYNTVPSTSEGKTITIIGAGTSEDYQKQTTINIVGDITGIHINGSRSGIKNIVLNGDGGATGLTTVAGIMHESSRGMIENVIVKNCRYDGIKFRFGNCSSFKDISCLSNKANGFIVDGTGYVTPSGVSRPNDCNASTFTNIDIRLNGDNGLVTGDNSGFSNFYQSITSQYNKGYGVLVKGDYNRFFGVYVENNMIDSSSPKYDFAFDTNADYNEVYGLFSNYNNITDFKYKDVSTNQANNISGYYSTNINPKSITLEASITMSSLLSSWVSASPNGYKTPAYYKDKFGIVHLEGAIKDGTNTLGTELFQLPSGYRPSSYVSVCGVNDSSGTPVVIQISPAGVLRLRTAGTTLINFDSVSFRV